MKNIAILTLCLLLYGASGCNNDDDGGDVPASTFTVTIENVSATPPFFQSGIFNTPNGHSAPGPVLPNSGDSYSFSFHAGSDYLPMAPSKLSFNTMLVASNDLFFAPAGAGIDLYDQGGNAITGDITDQIHLWDAGTEVNRAPGSDDQPPAGMPKGTGTDESGTVMLLEESGGSIPVIIVNEMGDEETFNYPTVNEMIKVTLTNSGTLFTVTIENVSGSSSLATPLSPGGYAVHTNADPFFTSGEAARNNGLEDIAEDGDPVTFNTYLEDNTGLIVPLSPGVFAVHDAGINPLYTVGSSDNGEGLEAIAEDGMPSTLASALNSKAGVVTSGAFDTPVGATTPGAIGPGGSYSFEISAKPGQRLSLATMFVQSNDWIYGFDSDGIELFEGTTPISGSVSNSVALYDVGTEEDQYPGAGPHQAIRQAGANTGAADDDTTIRQLNPDTEGVPANGDIINITVTAN